jgi:hypothetical protein
MTSLPRLPLPLATTAPYLTAMLVCGIVLFVFALGMIVYLVRQKQSFASANVLLAIAIVMIGFPVLSEVSFLGVDIKKSAEEVQKNPFDVTAANAFREKLRALDQGGKARPLSPDEVAALQSTVRSLQQRANLPAETRVAQAHAELLLGETKAAAATLDAALKAKPSLRSTLDPRLTAIARTTH